MYILTMIVVNTNIVSLNNRPTFCSFTLIHLKSVMCSCTYNRTTHTKSRVVKLFVILHSSHT